MSLASRIAKRFRREHRHGPPRRPLLPNAGDPWKFHDAVWGDLTVVVMPRTCEDGHVEDSNTGVVTKAPYHESLRAAVVVNDGRRPSCDEVALNRIVCGNPRECWMDKAEPVCVPRRRPPSDREGAYQDAIDAIKARRGCGEEEAIGIADQVLGWGADSLHCSKCKLTIYGIGNREIFDQAREYGWQLRVPPVGTMDNLRCGTCAQWNAEGFRPIPSTEELARIIPGEEWS